MTTPDAPSVARPDRHRALRWIFELLLPLLIVGFIAEDVLERERFTFESPLLTWVHTHTTPLWTQLSMLLHTVGGPAVMGAVFVALPVGLWLSGRHRQGMFALTGLGASVAVTALMKLVFDRSRPELWPRLVTEHGPSFPSGHSTFAAALATTLTVLAWRTRWRWPVLAITAVYAALSGVARLVLGVHYPTDVLAGWLTGVACVVTAYDLTLRARPGDQAAPREGIRSAEVLDQAAREPL